MRVEVVYQLSWEILILIISQLLENNHPKEKVIAQNGDITVTWKVLEQGTDYQIL